MGNIVPGCLVLIIRGKYKGKACHVEREVEPMWRRFQETEWILDIYNDDGRQMAGRESHLLRIDNHNPSLEEIAELINDEVKS